MCNVHGAVAIVAELLQCGNSGVLRRHAHPDVTSAEHVFPGEEPHVLCVEIVGDIVPFHQNRSVEPFGICRPSYDNSSFIRMIAVNDTSRCLCRSVVSAGDAIDKKFLLDVTVSRQVVVCRKEGVVVCRAAGETRRCNRSRYCWIGNCGTCRNGESEEKETEGCSLAHGSEL
jgi:hypothetical protein